MLNTLLHKNTHTNFKIKLVIYKTHLKPIWTYSIQLWGTASISNVEILERYQAKTLRLITNAPWFVSNNAIRRDLAMLNVKDEISRFNTKYLKRLSEHTNALAISLLDETDEVRRLKRFHPLDLPFRN